MSADRKQLGPRLPVELVEWYQAEAERRGVSVNYLINVACHHWRRHVEGESSS